ncbi:MAG: hypothetical protein HDS39_06860 [Bacteroides sp.]|nr:hypothetical protein [Bacteroides sp.]
MRKRCSLILMMLPMLVSCGGVSDNIYILADTSMPDESVEEEFCRKTGVDNYPIVNLDEKEE